MRLAGELLLTLTLVGLAGINLFHYRTVSNVARAGEEPGPIEWVVLHSLPKDGVLVAIIPAILGVALIGLALRANVRCPK